jgi:hypothetical protein
MKIDQTLEMAYPRKVAQDIIIGLARPMNLHLIKLVGFEFSPELRQHFKNELENWLDEIQRIRLKPRSRTGSFNFYFDPLFDYPFGGIEIENMQAMTKFLSSRYGNIQPTKSPQELVAWLKRFHTELAERLHRGEAVLDLIPT